MEINLKFIWRPAGGAWCKVKWLNQQGISSLVMIWMTCLCLLMLLILMGDVTLNEQLDAIAADITGFPCIHCEKVCKTQRGLSRHTNVKHANVLSTLSNEPEILSPTPLTPLEVSMKKLHPVKLRVMVKMCAENIAPNLCFPVSTRTKFSIDNLSFLHDDAEALWYKLLPTKFDDKTLNKYLDV